MRYGFVIDQRKCIGCHACTVACKEENRVPLGSFRTWVKYVERGTFPDTRRYFTVLRCNHCDRAPCVAICPTVALYRRPDGIVDFDNARCIGCKSCLQACPYDALYIDPTTQTAAKCHYCAHRVEAGLEPACVIVCPEQAIIAGDLDDPHSRIARLVATEQVQVRKAEQGTQPKVFYLGADGAALAPQLHRPTARYLWAERPSEEVELLARVQAGGGDGRGTAGAPEGAAVTRPVYDVPHMPRPWGRKVSTYLWTKAVAAGSLLVAGAAMLAGGAGAVGSGGADWLAGPAAPVVALVFLLVTTALLVLDLKRPDRFLYILLRPNPASWLVWGAWILMAFGGLAVLWLAASLAGASSVMHLLAPPAVLLSGATAGYSAFLFGQAEGRDFWQSPLLLPHLLVGAVVAGAAALLMVAAVGGAPAGTVRQLGGVLVGGLALHGLVLGIELGGPHGNLDAARAAHLVTGGPWRGQFWAGVVLAGILAPPPLMFLGAAGAFVAATLALAGLWLYEELWVSAGQSLPLS